MKRCLTTEAFDVLEQIEKTSSSNEKKQWLMDNKDNNILFNLLYWTYNPFYHYYMNKIDLDCSTNKNHKGHKHNVIKFKRILSELNNRRVTGNVARDMVINFLKTCDSIEQKWYMRVLKRDLKIGVSITTINKVYDNVIGTFPVALAENPEIRVYPNNFCIDEKFDGYRCITDITRQNVAMFSRNGNELNGYDDIINLFSKCHTSEYDVILDGELISSDFKGTQNNAFRKTSNKKANYYIFDIIHRKSFYDVDGFDTLANRIELRHKYINMIRYEAEKQGLDSSFIIEVEPLVYYYNGRFELREDFIRACGYSTTHFKARNEKQITQICDEAFQYALDIGREGVIVKDLDSLYMEGKSYASTCIDIKQKDSKWYSWAKRKPNETYDLIVDSVYEGTGRNVRSLGGVNVIYKASDGKDYLVGVGSGFKQDERDYYWSHKNEIIGHTIEVVADVESQDADGNYSLRFPRFKCIRKDK